MKFSYPSQINLEKKEVIRRFIGRLSLALLTILCVQIPAVASGSAESPLDNYRVLNWEDLVPQGWARPVIARAYDINATIDEASVVKDLDGQLAALPGYIQPVAFEGNMVSEFLLVPFLPHMSFSQMPQSSPKACVHPHFEPNQMVYVRALEPFFVDNPFKPIWIVGAMSLGPVMADSGLAAYRMDDAMTTPYEY